MEEKKELTLNNGGVTDEQIAMWKNTHRKVSEVSIVDGDEEHRGYFARPKMDTMAAVNKLSKTDEVKAANILFDNCWLGGSPMIKEDAVLKMAAIGKINTLMEVTAATVKNL